ncbi:MAG: DUF4386 family protein, partial [Candidatus Micrarchaeaceae archaeon]
AYYVLGLPAWALASTLYSVLWLNSKFIPKTLAIFGIATSVWAVVCGFGNLAVPPFDRIVNVYLYDVPMIIFEVVLGIWLLVRGLRVRGDDGLTIRSTGRSPAARARAGYLGR